MVLFRGGSSGHPGDIQGPTGDFRKYRLMITSWGLLHEAQDLFPGLLGDAL